MRDPVVKHFDLPGAEVTVFCSWGDGPDVGLNIRYQPKQGEATTEFRSLDFLNGKQAIEFAKALIECGLQAIDMDKGYADHVINELQEGKNDVEH
jgi:hypothetical protein